MRSLMNSMSQASQGVGLRLVLVASLVLSVAACSEDDVADGRVLNGIILPVDFALDLHCADVGLADEDCVFDDPANPYARAAISNENKFELADNSPSAKSSFYLWATALARDPSGENQFYTAQSLHELYTRGGSSGDADARMQAIRAYRAQLDNYFDALTFSAPDADGNQISFDLKDWAGERIYSPGRLGLAQLFDSQADALANLNQWGYAYDPGTRVLLRSNSQSQ